MRFFYIKCLLLFSTLIRAFTGGRYSAVGRHLNERVGLRFSPSMTLVATENVSPLVVVLCHHVIEDVFGIDSSIEDVKHSVLAKVDGDERFLNADKVIDSLYAPPFAGPNKMVMLLSAEPLKAVYKNENTYDVYGYAALNWGVSVVSTSISAQVDPSEKISLENFAKVVVHEMGHMLRLKHCDNDNCIMNKVTKAGGIDTLSATFCAGCTMKLERGGK